MQDSSKAIQEKFALTRELERLRPEMDHLKSQLTNYQAMVAEKNDLRRQLDSLEVELENEKRSRQRAQLKEDDAAMAGLKSRLEKAEKKLAADVKEREKARTELESELSEAQALGERLEERVESLRGKYRASQSELKETRSRLETCQAELEMAKKPTARSAKEAAIKKSVTKESGINRKRRAQEMSYDDMTIQTPGNGDMASKRPAAKKCSAKQAVVGDKSNFSITPFLKRTRNLSDESLEEASDEAGPDATFADQEGGTGPSETAAEPEIGGDSPGPAVKTKAAAPKRKVQSKAAPKAAPKPRGRPRTKGLAEASPAQVNKASSKMKCAAAGKPRVTLDTLTEVPAAEEQENASGKAPGLQSKGLEGDAKKKKRKLLGTATLLDNEDELLGNGDGETTAAKVAAKLGLAPGKKPRLQLGGGGDTRNAFAGAAFSPLKRDRRGANASFLA